MTIDLDALEAMDSIVPKRTKALFDGIKARRNARGFHMPQDIDDAEESHAKLERELSAASAEAEMLREALETILWRPLGESARIARAALAATRKGDSNG
jgi:hypothetical protein